MKKISFQQQVLLGFAFSILVVLAINYFAFSSIRKLNANAGTVNHTQEVLNKGNDLYVLLLNSETGQRGYVITGQDSYLDVYRRSVNSVDDALKSLSALISDNPKQVATVDSIRTYSIDKMEEMQLVIDLRRNKGFEEARKRVLTDKGKILMAALRVHINALFQEELRLLKFREAETESSTQQSYIVIVVGFVLVMGILLLMFFNITRTFRLQREAEEQIKKKNIELGIITDENIRKNWLLTGSTLLNEKIRGEHTVNDLSDHIMKSVAGYLDARMAALYLYDRVSNELVLSGTYSYGIHQSNARTIKPGEGLLGQAALDKNIIIYNNIPADYVKIQSGLGSTIPKSVLIAPVYSGSKMQAVIELGFSEDIDQTYLDYLEFTSENIAIAIQSAKAREVMQQQSEELQAQQEE
ncbi:MAG: CHASE3 domain-containing protein, partial [Bacteroidota bacterium]